MLDSFYWNIDDDTKSSLDIPVAPTLEEGDDDWENDDWEANIDQVVNKAAQIALSPTNNDVSANRFVDAILSGYIFLNELFLDQ